MADKAQIIVLDSSGKEVNKIPVMYNPVDYSASLSSEIKGDGSKIKFQSVKVDDFTVPLFFDTYEKKTDVRKETEKITVLMEPTVQGKKTKQPPICLFCWGGFVYKGIVHKISQKFTMFLQTGIPVRCELSVTFKSVITSEEDAKFKGKDACRKFWTVKSGDRLDLIAEETLKDPALWRLITETNGIIDPMSFPSEADVGRVLIIPDNA